MKYTTAYLIAMAAGLHSPASAAISKSCWGDSVCYSLNVPDETATAGNGNIYFQISAPTTYQWVGLGQGSMMAGANIFVMYTSADGTNVTISPRLGVGHVEPENDGATANLTLLEGSGVMNGSMVANVRCSNCNTWTGGTMDFTSGSADWIRAYKTGQSLDSDDLNEEIVYHDEHDTFTWDLSSAKGGDQNVNPFVAVADSTTSSTTTTTTTTSASSSSGSSSSGSNMNTLMMVHGILASLTFVVIMPSGGILIRLVPTRAALFAHAAIQILGWLCYVPAFGIGVYLATKYYTVRDYHPIIGIIVLALIFFQPTIGLLHHKVFKKTGHRNIWSVAHIGMGRIAIVLGMINGGLGMYWAANVTKKDYVAYGVVAGVFGLAYIVAIIIGETRRQKRKGKNSRVQSSDGEK